jgi:uncharacterized caspase-like protein
MRRGKLGIVGSKCWFLVFALSCLTNSGPALADKRVALVVGNSAYVNVPRLSNPANDARLMADTLRSLGFTLVGGGAQFDLDKTRFDNAVQDFGNQLQGADVGLFYFAGHGVQVRGANYLVPIGANPTREADVDFQMLDTNLVLRQMEGAGTKLNLVILDACRNNPFGGRGLRAANGGLAQMQAPEGTLISYATQPGNVAQDGTDGDSPYSRALAQTLRRPGLGVLEAFNEVGLAVKQMTGGAQQPWVSSSPISGHFQFAAGPATTPTPVATPEIVANTSEAERAWLLTRDTANPALLEAFIKQFGGTYYAELARARLNELATANRPAERSAAAPPAQTARLSNPATGDWSGSGTPAGTQFGGPPFCKYNVLMKDLKLTTSVDGGGNVVAANLSGTMVENIVGKCPFAPLGTKIHSYTGGGTVDGKTITLQLNPAPGNAPHALATFKGQLANGRLSGTLTLHRNDIGGDLAWTLQSVMN